MTNTAPRRLDLPAARRPALASAWGATMRRLAPLGLRRIGPDQAFRRARGSEGRVRLLAGAWAVGPSAEPVAECRIVYIRGAASEILTTMIFPTLPGRVPVFAGELLVFGGRPRMAFVDLPAPGLTGPARDRLSERVVRLAARFRHLPADRPPPDWSVAYSVGGVVCTWPGPAVPVADLVELYTSYLDLWNEVAREREEDGVRGVAAGPAEEIESYKLANRTHSPGRPYLNKVFGEEWSAALLERFLYA